MIRKQVYIEPRQERRLKRLARKTGKTEAEIIRQALDTHVDEAERRQDRLKAWDEEKEFIRQRMAKHPPPPGPPPARTWKREDLYDRPYPGRH